MSVVIGLHIPTAASASFPTNLPTIIETSLDYERKCRLSTVITGY